MKQIVLINPNIMTQKSDIASSGIPYWPITLAYAAAVLRLNKKFKINVIDAFGEKPKQIHNTKTAYIQGLTPLEVTSFVHKLNPDIIVTYAGTVMNHEAHIEIIKSLRQHFAKVPIITIENTQQVTSYKLGEVAQIFLSSGSTIVYSGEPEKYLEKTIKFLLSNNTVMLKKIPGLTMRIKGKIFNKPTDDPIWKLDKLPYPAWDLFPVKNYWDLGYAHGPKNHHKYLPMYTSRGCPFGCAFCTIPQLNNRLWRGRTGKNVVEEMAYWANKFKVKEFHIEDVNPAIVGPRMVDLSNELIKRKLKLQWKLVSGTKVEALTNETIKIMAKAGCKYISISPESGSPRMLKLMNKPFAHKLALDLVSTMHESGITTQACFVLGFPGESESDRKLTWEYVKQLAKKGLDEIAPFIMTPIPGSSQWGKKKGYKYLSELTFSPVWRSDFFKLHVFRLRLFFWFNFWRLLYNPTSIIKTIQGLLTGKFFTKTEMTIHRLIKVRWWDIVNPA